MEVHRAAFGALVWAAIPGIKDTLTTNDDGAPSRTQQLRLQILETGV